ncbi:DUF4919 domain-containing protein [Chryseobacterium wangxinyae]|uniref:DUF4919 domain-containing protein n=1 Tax=Chryseobacterium sp. CY353 TaxID=2997334 RepID=UPI002271698B|nr:DUF4919 domain-containing protein [Chryseobacterium sp. CY353]MCY0969111.1 DUF4919 domain-containing protein [Chryseobacterium sp. CY353]
MKKLFLLALLLFFGISFSQINTVETKKNVTENPQKYYYDYLEIFKKDPSKLSQEEMNQLYYGSRFIESGYSLSTFNDDYDEIWKIASRKGLSKTKALKILEKAESAYHKAPMNIEILTSMVNIYDAIKEKAKAEICVMQNNRIIKTIDESGTGRSEESPICVITAGEMLNFAKPIMMMGGNFKQKDLKTDEGCILTQYSNGSASLFVKCIGCFNF